MVTLFRSVVLSSLLLVALGCPGGQPPITPVPETDLAGCGLLGEPAGWDRTRTEAIVRLGEPVHSVIDAVATPDETPTLRAKLSYGPTSADLEGERVEGWIQMGDQCADWTRIGETLTDDDGRIALELEGPLPVGIYSLAVVALGDASTAFGFLHVLEADQPIVIFDIDGTLTTSDVELIDGIVVHHVGATSDEVFELAGSPLTRAQWLTILDRTLEPDATMHAGADEVVRWYAERGIQPVYITGRPYLYDGMTREWLAERGMPAGPLVLVQAIEEALPAYVDDYKERSLGELSGRGFSIEAAYGNAHTDICAYARAGVAADRTFIIGPNAGDACDGYEASTAIASYPAHLLEL
ncbi:MAG: hypothetical protein JJ863_25680 [Deltaproteobacteria bacterium]|nr:hypothetical protein [Deltaproteobacteria bacterium]